ncbi:hypothetical protein [Microlunatus speluncae]|uniref:hypothetical protein n=1 Tax=Microlunatus speluncae TaxID=2594267 RepID=UPI0012660A99|nr:hypothetical protein [Microlunatus speluncae]
MFYPHNLIEQARAINHREWPELVESYVGSHLALLAEPDLEDLSDADLRRQLRVRLIAADDQDEQGLAYARPFLPGIIRVLCLETRTAVSTLTVDSLARLPLGLDELYEQGQANTDAVPVDHREDLDGIVRTLEGESFFIASKAANFPALTSTLIGPAPFGVVFAIPNRHLLLYSTPDPNDWMESAVAVTEIAAGVCADEELDHPGGVISPDSFYWAPDGTVEPLAGNVVEASGEQTMAIRPGVAFTRTLRLGDS